MVARAPVAGGVQRADADPLVEAAGGEHIVELVSAKRFRSVVSPALDRPEFAANPDRVRRRKELRALPEPVFREHPVTHWEAGLGEVGVPVGRVRSVAEILASPQLRARDCSSNGTARPSAALRARRPTPAPTVCASPATRCSSTANPAPPPFRRPARANTRRPSSPRSPATRESAASEPPAPSAVPDAPRPAAATSAVAGRCASPCPADAIPTLASRRSAAIGRIDAGPKATIAHPPSSRR